MAMRWSPSTPSTRVRILGWYIVLVAGAIVFGLLLQRSILMAQLNDEVNEQLRQEVGELEQLSSGRDPNTGEPFGLDVRAIFETFLRRNIPVEDEALFTLIDGEAHASTPVNVQLLDDPAIVAEWAAIDEPTQSELDTAGGRVRYLAVPVLAEAETAGVFVVAIFLDPRRANVEHVTRVGIAVSGSSLLVVSAIAWFAAGRVLRPVSQLTSAARSITDANWSERIPVRGDDQIAELAQTFNEMLDRLEAAFATQRQFLDDAGHELRTPITIIRGHLELLGDEPAERRDTTYLVTDELDRMSRLVEELLLLARAEHPDFLDLHPLDVAELTEETAAKAAAIADRAWLVEETAPVVIVGDRQRLTQALMNLGRNAAEHTEQGARIAVGSRANGSLVMLWVRDEGEGIPPDDRARLFERFARGRDARRGGDGAGLGLAIVKAIAEAHGGRVTLDSQPGRGSTFTLELPVDGPAGAAQ